MAAAWILSYEQAAKSCSLIVENKNAADFIVEEARVNFDAFSQRDKKSAHLWRVELSSSTYSGDEIFRFLLDYPLFRFKDESRMSSPVAVRL